MTPLVPIMLITGYKVQSNSVQFWGESQEVWLPLTTRLCEGDGQAENAGCGQQIIQHAGLVLL